MDVPNREDLLALMAVEAKPCLSIYMCTDRIGADTQQNPIRLRNLLRKAEDRLVTAGVRVPEAREILQPAYDLLLQSDFWRHMGDGLALFLARGFFRTYRVPRSFDEPIVASTRFYIKPLLPLLAEDGRFYVLALSQGGVRLYRGTRHSVTSIELQNIPADLRASLNEDESPASMAFVTSQRAVGASSERGGVSYGTGIAENEAKRNIVNYFRAVDKGLRRTVQDEQTPLLLAGVEYLLPLYREANTHPALLSQELATGTEWLDARELHAKAWRLVEPIFASARRKALDLFRQLFGEASPKASADLHEVVPASYYGRVGTLLVAEGAQEWGTFDPATGAVTWPSNEIGAEDLLDVASLYTLQNSGTVYAVPRTDIPSAAPLAALFRY